MSDAKTNDPMSVYYGSLQRQSEQLDEKILWASGGVFGVSITFLLGLLPRITQVQQPILLASSWLVLAVAVGTVLANLQVSMWGFQSRIKALTLAEGKRARPNAVAEGCLKAVNLLNGLALVLLLVGLVLVAVFAFVNLNVTFPLSPKS